MAAVKSKGVPYTKGKSAVEKTEPPTTELVAPLVLVQPVVVSYGYRSGKNAGPRWHALGGSSHHRSVDSRPGLGRCCRCRVPAVDVVDPSMLN